MISQSDPSESGAPEAEAFAASAEVVELRIPCRPEYVGVARLAVLGIASRMPFSYDEVEDVRLAVGEACTRAIERAGGRPGTLRIVSAVTPDALSIEVSDDVPESEAAAPTEESRLLEEAGVDQEHLGALLMEILVDEVDIEAGAGGTRVRLTKFAPD